MNILSFNAAIQDVRILGRSFYCPVAQVRPRLENLAGALIRSDADIIFLQELFHHDLQHELYKAVRQHYPYISGLAGTGFRLRLGNELLILSRYPLHGGTLIRFQVAAREELRHTSRGFFHATVTLPGLGPVDLVNVHTTAGGRHGHPESGAMNRIRAGQLAQLLSYTRTMNAHILAGDLNAGPHTSTANYRQVLAAGYTDVYAYGDEPGYTWDPLNPLVAGGREAHLPAQRIDHILLDPQMAARVSVQDCRVTLREHCVAVAKGRLPLSDHYAVTARLHHAG